MSAVTIEQATITEIQYQDFVSPIPELPDQTATLLPETENSPTASWDSSVFHTLIESAKSGEIGAIHALAEISTIEIQNGNLGEVLRDITSSYEGDPAIQSRVREIVMRQYMIVSDERGMGPATYNAVT